MIWSSHFKGGRFENYRTLHYIFAWSEIVAEWMNAGAMETTDIPDLLIPKWVRGAAERRREAEREPQLNLIKTIIA